LVDPVVDSHEVGVFSELGDDLSSAYALSLACDHCNRHEAFLRGSVYSALDRLESFHKVADGEIVAEASATFAALPVTLLCLQGSRLLEHQQRARRRRYLQGTCLGPSLKVLGVADSHEDLATRGAEAGLRNRHLSWVVRVSSGKWCALLER
jgi:hypothetical protein